MMTKRRHSSQKTNLRRLPYLKYILVFACGAYFGPFITNKITDWWYLINQWIQRKQKLAQSPALCDIPENAPEDCPGLESAHAGKAEACAGCPNRDICASGAPKVQDPKLEDIQRNLSQVQKKVLVLSGKGGVGKSTLTAQLSWLLQERGLKVGLLDIDICGPSIPIMTGSRGMDVHQSADGWSPIYVESNLAVMSIGFLLPKEDDAVIWRGPKKNGLIRQFLSDVNWGPLDILLVDTPPGTSDEHLSIVTYLRQIGIDGALVVTTPQEVALMDVRKEIMFCKRVGIPVLGLVENMKDSIFDAQLSSDDLLSPAEKTCALMEIAYAGNIPLDKALFKACELGISVTKVAAEDSPVKTQLNKLINGLLDRLNLQKRETS